jgi:maltooligosyltrehalose trehalohydrolase
VRADGSLEPLRSEGTGYFSATIPGIKAGDPYWFSLDSGERLPDPASRFQPQGLRGPSAVVDPLGFAWSDADWNGPGQSNVYYELHVGTFTPEGTFAAAAERLSWLKDIGITVVEIMPINTFDGSFGWGYDGVLLFAPHPSYGEPDDVRRFVDTAHRLGIGVILDVVYNHFGPHEVCSHYAAAYFGQRPPNEWGRSMNFDGPGSGPVREFFCTNAAYWIDEFHFDGLRIDATQALLDDSEEHIVVALGRAAREAARSRRILLISENEPQESFQVRPLDQGGYGLDALWNDDFHHSARVALTGRREAYFHDHHGAAPEFVAAAKYGYLFQGQRYDWQNAQRGYRSLDLPPHSFVHFIQNHDQIANNPGSRRICQMTGPAQLRAMTALLLLGPQSPMLFQGQEFGATTPFFYFFEQSEPIAQMVWEGRRQSVSQFPSLDQKEARDGVPPPHDRAVLEQSKLDWSEAERNRITVDLHRDLLALRRNTKAFQRAQTQRSIDGAVINEAAFLLRFFGDDAVEDRLLVVNFGEDLPLRSIPEPLYAPPDGHKWQLLWSSEDARYGGTGQREVDTAEPWVLTAHTALLFQPLPAKRRVPVEKRKLDQWQRSIRAT